MSMVREKDRHCFLDIIANGFEHNSLVPVWAHQAGSLEAQWVRLGCWGTPHNSDHCGSFIECYKVFIMDRVPCQVPS